MRYTRGGLHTEWGVGYTRSGVHTEEWVYTEEWGTHGGVGIHERVGNTRRSGVHTEGWETHEVGYTRRGTHGVRSEVHTKWGMKYTRSGIDTLSEIHIRSGKWDVYGGRHTEKKVGYIRSGKWVNCFLFFCFLFFKPLLISSCFAL